MEDLRKATERLAENVKYMKAGGHYRCEDSWYDCEKSDEYCGPMDDVPLEDRECTCTRERDLETLRCLRVVMQELMDRMESGFRVRAFGLWDTASALLEALGEVPEN